MQASKKHDEWFRARVQEALEDKRPAVPNEQVRSRFAKRRAEGRKKRIRNIP